MSSKINNDFYDTLGEDWYQADDHAIALLRAEQKTKNPWVMESIDRYFSKDIAILDIACGGGFLTNHLATKYREVYGVDFSVDSLKVAKAHDHTGKVHYQKADAYSLPFDDQSFEVVCLMDFLEHVENPKAVLAEAKRVLKPGGLIFYHTFNRNPLSWLIVLKAVEWLMPKAPKDLHVYQLFIKPQELMAYFDELKLQNLALFGMRPVFNRTFFKSLYLRRVLPEFKFVINNDTKLAYLGYAKKN